MDTKSQFTPPRPVSTARGNGNFASPRSASNRLKRKLDALQPTSSSSSNHVWNSRKKKLKISIPSLDIAEIVYSPPCKLNSPQFRNRIRQLERVRILRDKLDGLGGPWTGGPNYAVSMRRGNRRRMEDAFCVAPTLNNDFDQFFGVFDGHGVDGQQAAVFAAQKLGELAARDQVFAALESPRAVRKAFHTSYTDVNNACLQNVANGGTTATCCLIRWKQRKAWIAACGDSRAVVSKAGVAHDLSVDHKPDRSDEKARIEADGGRVLYHGAFRDDPSTGCWRVEGILNVSRSIGDRKLDKLVKPDPEIKELAISPSDEFIIIATDGLWNVMSSQKAVDLVRPCVTAAEAAEVLTTAASELRSNDNICVLVVYLQDQQVRPSSNTVVFNGNMDNRTSESHGSTEIKHHVCPTPSGCSKVLPSSVAGLVTPLPLANLSTTSPQRDILVSLSTPRASPAMCQFNRSAPDSFSFPPSSSPTSFSSPITASTPSYSTPSPSIRSSASVSPSPVTPELDMPDMTRDCSNESVVSDASLDWDDDSKVTKFHSSDLKSHNTEFLNDPTLNKKQRNGMANPPSPCLSIGSESSGSDSCDSYDSENTLSTSWPSFFLEHNAALENGAKDGSGWMEDVQQDSARILGGQGKGMPILQLFREIHDEPL